MTNLQIYANAILERVNGKRDVVGAEIGVECGNLSSLILSDHRISMLYMIDSWADPKDQPAEYLATGDYHAALSLMAQESNLECATRATGFACDRRKIIREPSVKAAEGIPDHSLDFVFIDGDHSYEGCRDDIKAWTPKVKPGGYLSGHDYKRPGSAGCSEKATAGVTVAVDEAVKANGWKLVLGGDYTWFVKL